MMVIPETCRTISQTYMYLLQFQCRYLRWYTMSSENIILLVDPLTRPDEGYSRYTSRTLN